MQERSSRWGGHNDFLLSSLPVISMPPSNHGDKATRPLQPGQLVSISARQRALAHPLPSLSAPWSIPPLPINASTNHFIFSFSPARSSRSRHGHRTRMSQGAGCHYKMRPAPSLLPNQRASKHKIKPIKRSPVFQNERAHFSCCQTLPCFSLSLSSFFLLNDPKNVSTAYDRFTFEKSRRTSLSIGQIGYKQINIVECTFHISERKQLNNAYI